MGEDSLCIVPDQADIMTTENSHAFDADGGWVKTLMECASVGELVKKGVRLDKKPRTEQEGKNVGSLERKVHSGKTFS